MCITLVNERNRLQHSVYGMKILLKLFTLKKDNFKGINTSKIVRDSQKFI